MKYVDILTELTQFAPYFDSTEYLYAYEKLTQALSFPSVQVIGLGAGRMGYSLRAFIMRLSHMGIPASMIGDTDVPRCDQQTVVIVNSSSGNTPSLVLYAGQAKVEGSQIFLFTSNRNSKLGKIADVTSSYGTGISQQCMKTLYEQFSFILFDKLAEDIRERLGIERSFMETNHSVLE